MCGIIGYAGHRLAVPILMNGLRALEYRGYDSAGIAVVTPQGTLAVHRAPGKLSALESALAGRAPEGEVGVGHTRWATHGRVTRDNAHPHTDCQGNVVVVHNGIVENYLEIKRRLVDAGHRFRSQTDTEVIPHLVEEGLAHGLDLGEATRRAALQLQGAHAVAVLSRDGRIAAFRLGNAGGLTVGYGEGETFVASDLPALLPHTRRVSFLASGEMALLDAHKVSFMTLDGRRLEKEAQTLHHDPISAAKGGHKHFMLKEITEQPQAVVNTLRGRVSFDPPGIFLEEVPFTDEDIKGLRRVVLVGMGTSWIAAQIGRLWMEALAGIPSEADNAAEFRYRNPVLDSQTLVVSVGQSGETADTLAAMEVAQWKGARQLTVCNVEGSQASRLAEGTLFMRAGLEVGVAATKTFLCSLVTLYLLAAHLGHIRGSLSPERTEEVVAGLAHLPQLLGQVLERQGLYREVALQYWERSNFLYLGRGLYYPVALEGALKLKEVSYIHAEGYPAGEMKHGPIALVDKNLPVVALAPQDGLRDKMLGNISEVRARGGSVIALVTDGDEELLDMADHVLAVPAAPPLLGPLLAAIPLQLMAYHIAVRRGCDVDQPRNLAKSVTVE